MSIAKPLALEDRREIVDLVARYNWTVDHFEAEAWAATFTADGALLANGQERARGTAALTAYIQARKVRGTPVLRHWVNNLLIDGTSEKARLRAYIMAYRIDLGLGPPYVMGEYDDELVKVNGEWKFRIRHMTVVAGQSATGR